MPETITTNVPRLAFLTDALMQVEKSFIAKESEIEKWFEKQWAITPAPLYGSVDLRNAGFKLAPVDMNLFPAGFNNIDRNPDFVKLSIEAAQKKIKSIYADTKNILLIPENHTRNVFLLGKYQCINSRVD